MWPMEMHLFLSAYLGSEFADQSRALCELRVRVGMK